MEEYRARYYMHCGKRIFKIDHFVPSLRITIFCITHPRYRANSTMIKKACAGNSITCEVEEWIADGDYPTEPETWDDNIRLMFKLRFIE